MVLQRGMPLSVWGSAEVGTKVSVEFAGQKKTATTDASGKWLASLDPLSAETRPQALTVSNGSDSLKCEDVLVGEVWHASGQSNMAMTVGDVTRTLEAIKIQIAGWNISSIRFRRVADEESATPLDQIKKGTWYVCSPDKAPSFSAAAFFFALRLHKDLKVPVAIIDSSRGGTPIEPFIPRQAFKSHPTLRREMELADQGDLAGLKALPGGVFARDANWLPGRIFNSRLAPLAQFAVRGVIWYQGESNCGVGEDPRDYEHKMRALMNGWRSVFQREQLPFYFVQLPGSGARCQLATTARRTKALRQSAQCRNGRHSRPGRRGYSSVEQSRCRRSTSSLGTSQELREGDSVQRTTLFQGRISRPAMCRSF